MHIGSPTATGYTSSTFPRLSLAEISRELRSSSNEKVDNDQRLLVRAGGGDGESLLAGWLVRAGAAVVVTDERSTNATERQGFGEAGRSQAARAGRADAENGHDLGHDVCTDRLSPPDLHHQQQQNSHSKPKVRSEGADQTQRLVSSAEARRSDECWEYKTSRKISRGDVVAVERPLAAIQTSDAMPWVVVCPGCLRHVGSLDLQLAIASNMLNRAHAVPNQNQRPTHEEPPVPPPVTGRLCPLESMCRPEKLPELRKEPLVCTQQLASSSNEPTSNGKVAAKIGGDEALEKRASSGVTVGGAGKEDQQGEGDGGSLPEVPGLTDRFEQAPVGCVMGCGAVYCGKPCRRKCWDSGHSVLCLGLANDEDHPLVQHKVHAVNSANAEAPLLIAAQLVVQAALAITRSRQQSAPSASSSTKEDEASAVEGLLDTLPRGRFRSGCGNNRAVNDAVAAESWTLLVKALSAASHGSSDLKPRAARLDGEDGRDDRAAGGIAINPDDFPMLLGKKVHADLVAGLAANLLDVEVQSPLVDYCEALVTRDGNTQDRALKILEPALRAMDEQDDQDEEQDEEQEAAPPAAAIGEGEQGEQGEQEQEESQASTPVSPRQAELTECKCGAAAGNSDLKGSLADSKATLEANRAAASRAWRCLQAARAAARLLPPLSAKALLPSVASLRHSTAPTVRVPAGDPRSYNSYYAASRLSGGSVTEAASKATHPRAGVGGWPLTVATVALRDLAAHETLTASWFDVVSDEEEEDDEDKQVGGVGLVRAREPTLEDYVGFDHRRGASVRRGPGNHGDAVDATSCGSRSAIAALGYRELLLAAEAAVGEDRFDDAFEILQRAARLAPENGDVLYRAGVCAINQGCWSRALRLWRDGLAISPNHLELGEEAKKYDALAFWLRPSADVSRTELGASRSRADAGGLRCHPTFGSPAAPPPPLSSNSTKLQEYQSRGICIDDIVRSSSSGAPESGGCSSSENGSPSPSAVGGRAAASKISRNNLDVTFMGRGEWVCETRLPLLSTEECAAVIAEAEGRAAAEAARTGGGSAGYDGVLGWGTTRHYSVPTTDMAVRDLPATLAWFNEAMRTRIAPLVAAAVALGGGDLSISSSSSWAPTESTVESHASTSNECPEAQSEEAVDFVRSLRVHDAFVVRYDATAQRSLPLHTDQGELSLTISLNSAECYDGGGTWFEGLGRAVRPSEPGHVLVFPGGEAVHAGREITSGVRYILAVFLYQHHVQEEKGLQLEEEVMVHYEMEAGE